MKRIICLLPLVPIRKEPSHRSEMTSQLLFGEKAVILSQKDEWLEIRTVFDNYTGWLETKSVELYENYNEKEKWLVNPQPILKIKKDGKQMLIPAGSELPVVLGLKSFTINKSLFEIINPESVFSADKKADIRSTAMDYINTPYLWGGKSIMGIDCSGFIQVIYRITGLALPRDAWQQAQAGTLIEKPEDAKTGDLFFFHNKEGKIIHVGMSIDKGRIIHASGSVRIDTIDTKGIYNEDLNLYTHQLHSVKQIIP